MLCVMLQTVVLQGFALYILKLNTNAAVCGLEVTVPASIPDFFTIGHTSFSSAAEAKYQVSLMVYGHGKCVIMLTL